MADSSNTLAAPRRIALRGRARAAFVAFAAGFALYLEIQLALVAAPMLIRPYPPSTQDSAGYILKAAELRDCPLQDCAALRDLRAQIANPAADAEVTWQRAREYHRVFYVYHPLHSVLLIALHATGLRWERALNLLSFIGALIIAAGIASFLVALWGWGPAGLGLGLLALVVFPGWHGVHWVVPGNFSLGVALLAWAAALRGGRVARLALPFLIPAMLWLHPIGRAYALVALLLHGAIMDRRRRTDWVALAIGVLAVLVYVALPYVVTRPALTYLPHTPPAGATWWGGLGGNLAGAWQVIADWSRRFGGPVGVVALVALGFVGLARRRRRRIAVSGLLLAGMTGASVFYVLARYPAEAFHRAWIPLVVFTSGAIGHAGWRWLRIAGAAMRAMAGHGRPWWRILSPSEARSGRGGGPRLVVGALLAYAIIANLAFGVPALLSKVRDMVGWRYRLVDLAQPAQVLARLRPGERVLYMQPMPLYLYLTYGGLDHGAVHYPAVAGTPLTRSWLAAPRRIRYAVAINAVPRGELRIRSGAPLSVRADRRRRWDGVAIHLANPGTAVPLSLSVDGGPALARLVPAGFSGWMRLRLPAPTVGQSIAIAMAQPDGFLRVLGLRATPESRLNWPWESGLVFRTGVAGNPENPRFTTRFRARDLLPKRCESRGVVADFGALAAFRVDCRATPDRRQTRSPSS